MCDVRIGQVPRRKPHDEGFGRTARRAGGGGLPQYLHGGRRSGQYRPAGDVAGGPGRSRYVHLSGAKAGRWRDPAAGRNGDLLDPIRLTRGTDSAGEAIDETARFLGFGGAAAGKGKDRVVRGGAPPGALSGGKARHRRVSGRALPGRAGPAVRRRRDCHPPYALIEGMGTRDSRCRTSGDYGWN